MTRKTLIVAVLACCAFAATPRPASADITGFLGISPTPATHNVKGAAIGVGLLIVGFEFEYANTAEDDTKSAPGVTTGMGNLLIQTPTTKAQLYVTAGGGIFRETYLTQTTTNFGTNVGGGVKIGLVGPLRLRLDYRIFKFNGTPLYNNPQRFYAGISLKF